MKVIPGYCSWGIIGCSPGTGVAPAGSLGMAPPGGAGVTGLRMVRVGIGLRTAAFVAAAVPNCG